MVSEKSEPNNRNEEEIAGYREVLNTIHENYNYIVPRANVILQLHRDLYIYNSGSVVGNYKNADNIIEEQNELGEKSIRFVPVPAYFTRDTMVMMCNQFVEALNKKDIDPLLLIPIFILDFLCVHPFNDGNGKMSRLLTLLLLYQNMYIVGKYISIEMSDITKLCLDISVTTIEKALSELLKEGYIDKVGGGRSTAYVKCDSV